MLQTRQGRARQLNVGARAATGDILCFLHADSRCCADVVNVVRRVLLTEPRLVAHYASTLLVLYLQCYIAGFWECACVQPGKFLSVLDKVVLSKLDSEVWQMRRYELSKPGVVAGAFATAIVDNGRNMWGLAAHLFAKTYYAPALLKPWGFLHGLRAVFGDQTMFMRAIDYELANGFDERWAIMEDADLGLRLHLQGTTAHPGKVCPVAT